jgi:hypothetical protein
MTAGKTSQDIMLKTCEQIGALIIGQRHDRMQNAVQLLGQQGRNRLLEPFIEQWVAEFEQHARRLEGVIGEGLLLDEGNLVNDLRRKVNAAEYKSIREFLTSLVLPLVQHHGLLLFLNNSAKVTLPESARERVAGLMNPLNKVLGGTCAAMVLQESMGL